MRLTDKQYKILSLLFISFVCLVLLLGNLFVITPRCLGEWDDYALVTASVINDGNVTVSQEDLLCAKRLMPEWSDAIDNYRLSGYFADNGDELSWYFPLYAIMCVPAMVLLNAFGISGIYAFSITSIILYGASLLFFLFRSSLAPQNKLGMLLVLCANPIALYTFWVSGEVFIFSFTLMALTCWTERKYLPTAVLLSVASTLNPTILAAGLVMIAEYLSRLLSKGIREAIKEWKYVLGFAVCFLPCFLPFLWNLYHIGHINMTAATETDLNFLSVWGRFKAYLFDLNLGFLPYYNFFFVIFLVVCVASLLQRNRSVIWLCAAFFGVCMCYSVEIHINSGMSGLARYSSWTAVIMVMAVFQYKNSSKPRTSAVMNGGVLAFLLCSGCMLLSLVLTNPIGYLEMTPLAKTVLRYAPGCYDPLPDIFNARVNHLDQIEYEQNLPIIYTSEDGRVRKILTRSENGLSVLDAVYGEAEAMYWLEQELNELQGEKCRYISVPNKYRIEKH